jgi:uncharacterized protein YkwD
VALLLLLGAGGAGAGIYFWPQIRQRFGDQFAAATTPEPTRPADSRTDAGSKDRDSSDPSKGSPPQKEPPVESLVSADPLAYIPADSSAVLGIDVAALLRVPAIKEAVEQGLKQEMAAGVAASVVEETGLDIRDLLGQVIVAVKLPPLNPAAPPMPEGMTVIIRTQHPFDAKKIARASFIEGPQPVQQRTCYRLKKDTPLTAGSAQPIHLFMPTDRLLVLSDLPAPRLEALVASDGKRVSLPPATGGMVRRLQKSALWMTVALDAKTQEQIQQGLGAVGEGLPPELAPVAKAAASARGVAVWATLDDRRLSLSLGLDCGDGKAAGELSAGLEGFWTKMQGPLREQLKPVLGQLPAELRALADDLLGNVRFGKQQSWAEASISVGMQPLEALAKKVQTEGPGELMKLVEQLASAGNPPPPNPLAAIEQQLLQLVNEARTKRKLPPLKLHAALAKLARDHAANMAKQDKLEDELDGKNFQQRLDASPYKYSLAVPLLARAGDKPEIPVGLWLKDNQLRKHLLGKFTDCGIGIAVNPNSGIYYYLVLAAPE